MARCPVEGAQVLNPLMSPAARLREVPRRCFRRGEGRLLRLRLAMNHGISSIEDGQLKLVPSPALSAGRRATKPPRARKGALLGHDTPMCL
jgi:hypothetical protein